MHAFNPVDIIDQAAAAVGARRAVVRASTSTNTENKIGRVRHRALRTKELSDALLSGLAILRSRSEFKYEISYLHDGAVVDITTNLWPARRNGSPMIEITPTTICLYGFSGNDRARRFHAASNPHAAADALAYLTKIIITDEAMDYGHLSHPQSSRGSSSAPTRPAPSAG